MVFNFQDAPAGIVTDITVTPNKLVIETDVAIFTIKGKGLHESSRQSFMSNGTATAATILHGTLLSAFVLKKNYIKIMCGNGQVSYSAEKLSLKIKNKA